MKIEFLINNTGELYSFRTSNEEEEIEEFRIPSIVNGVKVESIGDLRDAFFNLHKYGVKRIEKLIIEDSIKKIKAFAFSNIDIEIDTVVWPKSCKVIPHHCFAVSTIKAIVGIENVEKIGSSAFMWTLFKSFNWPAKCKVIPKECFSNCKNFERIENIEQVTQINAYAFYGTQLKRFSWPEKCKNISAGCFCECRCLERIDGIEEVTDIGEDAFQSSAIKKFLWPASVSATKNEEFLINCKHLEEIIFGGVGIKDVDLECLSYLKDVKKIDLSKCGAVNLINCSSPKGREVRDKVVLPYYVTEIN